jgi:hypothetical protein
MAGIIAGRRIIDWPSGALPFRAHGLNNAPVSISGGASLGNVERIRQSDAGKWRFRMDIRISQQPQILLVRALSALAKGRAGTFRICVGDCGRGPGAMPAFALPDSTVPHSDDAEFSDGSTYDGETAVAHLAQAAMARAAEIYVIMDTAVSDPQPGQLLTLDDGLHTIEEAEALGYNWHRLVVDPPLRRAVAGNTRVIFDRPTGLFQLASDDGLSLQLDLQKFSTLSVEFVERVLR